MANAAPAVAFPAPVIFEGTFLVRREDRILIDGYVRRSDPEFPIEYRFIRKGPDMARDKGRIIYGQKYNRVAQGRYEVDVRQRFVVIKQVRKAWLCGNLKENIMSEIRVAQEHGDNVHIGSILEALEDREHYYIIMPYLGDDLCEFLRPHGPQPEAPPEVTQSFVENLAFLKSLGILHCDISVENIMVSRNDLGTSFPLIDFAMAKQCAQDEHGQFLPIQVNTTRIGKFQFSSPECLGHSEEASLKVLDFGVDMWAIGCTLFCVWTGKHLYETRADASYEYFVLNKVDDRQVLENETVKNTLTLFKRLPQQQQNLLRRIFIHNPEDRVNVDDILDDPYFRQN